MKDEGKKITERAIYNLRKLKNDRYVLYNGLARKPTTFRWWDEWHHRFEACFPR